MPGFGRSTRADVPGAASAPRLQATSTGSRQPVRTYTTVGLSVSGWSVLKVSVPSWMSRAEEQQWVDKMARSYLRTASAERVDLTQRAGTLAARHHLPHPTAIVWADNMTTRWGSCTPTTGELRISTRLARTSRRTQPKHARTFRRARMRRAWPS